MSAIAAVTCALVLGMAAPSCADSESSTAAASVYAKRIGVDPSKSDVSVEMGPCSLSEWLKANPKILPPDHKSRVMKAVGGRTVTVVKFAPRLRPGEIAVGGLLWVFVDSSSCKVLSAYGEK
ncbi:MAG: hypothetical protein D3M94_22370 [Rhodocyclales bacterium GT-UBC]|nr:MAG: hypothetical protein D3M94_22370 [Rhodocyclales bacterium GT-UBC]